MTPATQSPADIRNSFRFRPITITLPSRLCPIIIPIMPHYHLDFVPLFTFLRYFFMKKFGALPKLAYLCTRNDR